MLTVLNYIFILAIVAASVLPELLPGGVGGAFDTFGAVGIVLPSLAFALILLRALRSPAASGRKLGVYWFLWPVAMVLASRTLFPADELLQSIYTMLLAVAVLLPALVRPEPVWIAVFGFIVAAYSAQLGVELRADFDIAAFATGQIQFAAVTFFTGLIPWWILKKRAEVQEKEFNKTLEEVRNNAITNAMARTRELGGQQETNAARKQPDSTGTATIISTGTLRLDSGADTLALLTEGGDEVNLQLKSMLFFIRYNFKGLSACAFIYDAPSRSLVLNCYDTKGGIQLRERMRVPFGAGIVGQTATDKNVFLSGDMSLYRNDEHTYYAQNQDIFSIMAAPIRMEGNDKELLGVLVVDSPNRNAFTEHDKELMKRFATIAAALIANIKMRLSLDTNARTFREFYEVSHKFSNALKLENIYSVLVERVPKLVPYCTRLVVALHDPANNVLRIELVAGDRGELKEGIEFSPDSGGIYSYAFNKNRSVPIPDLQAQKSHRFIPGEPSNPVTRSLLVMPITGGEENNCIGLFSVESSMPDLFKPDLEQVLTTITENASVAIARSLLYQKMEKLATTDGLTGLNNHRTFQERMASELERAKRYGRPLSLLLTDIDHFKRFNDTYGHPVGDLVLREIAGCIRTAVRINDIPARYGGEEFAVILPETSEQGGYTTAEKIRQMVEAKIIDSGADSLRVTISIGCVTFPSYGNTQQDIIDFADKALYASKKGGRNRVTMYDPSMTVASK
ncbi:MAG: diguanylate cyclase [Chitinispirillia bacterium]|nr:diguanylate cyclase [Chitinispirillia bacterium]